MADEGNSPVERRDILKIAGGAPLVLAPGIALKAKAQDSGTFEISNVVVEIDGSEQSKDDVVANQGQQGTVSADITNTGSETGVAEVFLALEGVKAETGDNPQTVELGPDETERVSFTGDTGLVPPGGYSGSLQTDSDTVTGNLTVLPVTEFEVRNPQPEDKELTVEQGEEVTVSADIVNVGDGGPVASGVELILRKEGESEFNVVGFGTTAKLDPGETDRVEFTGDTSELDPGTYEGGIRASPDGSGDRDSITGTLEVIESGGGGGNADLGLNSISGSPRELDNLVSGEEVRIKIVTDDGVDLSEELGTRDKIEWDFGDGTVDTVTAGFAQTNSHTYEESGTFDITVTVTKSEDFGQTELTQSVSEMSIVFPEGYEKQKEDKLTLAGEIDEISASLNEKERAEEVIASVEDSFLAQELGGQEAKDAVRRLTLGEQVTDTTLGSIATTDDGRPNLGKELTENGITALLIDFVINRLVGFLKVKKAIPAKYRKKITEHEDIQKLIKKTDEIGITEELDDLGDFVIKELAEELDNKITGFQLLERVREEALGRFNFDKDYVKETESNVQGSVEVLNTVVEDADENDFRIAVSDVEPIVNTTEEDIINEAEASVDRLNNNIIERTVGEIYDVLVSNLKEGLELGIKTQLRSIRATPPPGVLSTPTRNINSNRSDSIEPLALPALIPIIIAAVIKLITAIQTGILLEDLIRFLTTDESVSNITKKHNNVVTNIAETR